MGEWFDLSCHVFETLVVEIGLGMRPKISALLEAEWIEEERLGSTCVLKGVLLTGLLPSIRRLLMMTRILVRTIQSTE